MSQRGVAPVVGVAIILVMTLLLVGAVYALVPTSPPTDTPRTTFEGTFAVDDRSITLTHTGGDTVSLQELNIRITVDDEALTHQPPDLPYYNPEGFDGFASGPLNPSTPDQWEPGEVATIWLDENNAPLPGPEAVVTVEFFVDGRPIAAIELSPAPQP